MLCAGANLFKYRKCRHGDRCRDVVVGGRANPQLTDAVVAPTVGIPRSGIRTTKCTPGTYFSKRNTSGHSNCYRNQAIGGSAVTETSKGVLSPTIGEISGRMRTGVVLASAEAVKRYSGGFGDECR